MLKTWFEIKLWKRILGALVLGVIVGLIWGEGAESIKWIGDIFIRLIKMLIVPLIFTTLVSGVIAMGDPKKLGSIGGKAIGLYLCTTVVAIVIGLTLATVIEPGVGVDLSSTEAEVLTKPRPLKETLYAIVPTNPARALADGEVMPIIFFSIILGVGIMLAGEKGKPVARLFQSAAEAVLKVTHIVMEVAPFGVFALIAWVSGTEGISALINVAWLGAALYIGCLLHIVITYGGIIKFGMRLNPVRFFQGALDAQMVAYSTSSSSATLPVTMSVAEHNLGIKPTVASSVLPLGAIVNMDGTAIYVGIVAVFSAQVFGVPLGMAEYLLIALTTTMVSVGAAGIPSASLFLIAAVLGQIGITETQTAIIIGFVLPFDRILDMMRTVTNITGDLTVATAVAKSEGEFDVEVYNARPTE